jgi:hypothetical protein
MRPLNLGNPLQQAKRNTIEEWFEQALREIERASYEDSAEVADAFTITGTLTPTRELDVDSPTAENLAAVLGTFIDDLKKRGANRDG